MHYTENGKIADARRVIERGLAIEPADELMFRDLIRAEARIANHSGMQHAVERLDEINSELGLERESETDELLDELEDRVTRAAHG